MGDVIPIHMVAEGSFPFTGDVLLVHANRDSGEESHSSSSHPTPASALRATHCRCMNHESFRRPSDLLRTETECKILYTTHTVALSYLTR